METEKIMEWLLNGVQEGMSMTELTGLGMVTEEITDTEECRMITRTFTAKDKSMTKVITLYVPKEITNTIVDEYNERIEKAVAEQRYEDAAKLRDQRDALKK